MKKNAIVLVFITGLAAGLYADSQHILHASFPDGTGLEIFTQTSGSSQIDAVGAMGIGPGVGFQDLVNRVVVDRAGNILFVYNLEASQGATPGAVKIRILPISAASEAGMLNEPARPGRPRFAGTHLPTVAGVREFPAVKIGEVVTLDILYNPSTGERVYDVLRPITGVSKTMSVFSVVAPETISLRQIAVRVNGQALAAPAAWMIGAAVRIDIPGHGAYVVATSDPAATSPGFAAIAQADGKTLRWSMGRDRFEITSGTNILTRAAKGTLWIYHDPHYLPDVVGLQAADSVDWLLPKR